MGKERQTDDGSDIDATPTSFSSGGKPDLVNSLCYCIGGRLDCNLKDSFDLRRWISVVRDGSHGPRGIEAPAHTLQCGGGIVCAKGR